MGVFVGGIGELLFTLLFCRPESQLDIILPAVWAVCTAPTASGKYIQPCAGRAKSGEGNLMMSDIPRATLTAHEPPKPSTARHQRAVPHRSDPEPPRPQQTPPALRWRCRGFPWRSRACWWLDSPPSPLLHQRAPNSRPLPRGARRARGARRLDVFRLPHEPRPACETCLSYLMLQDIESAAGSVDCHPPSQWPPPASSTTQD